MSAPFLQILLTIIAGILNFVLGVSLVILLIGRNSKKDKDMFYFSIVCFAAAFWAISTSITAIYEFERPLITMFSQYISYLAPVFIPYAALKFAIYFLAEGNREYWERRGILSIPVLVVTGIFLPEIGLMTYQTVDGFPDVRYGSIFHILYGAYLIIFLFLTLLIMGLKSRSKRYKDKRLTLRLLMICIGVPFIVSAITNIFLQIIDIQDYYLLGPMSSLVTTTGIAYLFLRQKLFSIRIIYAEMMVLFAIMIVVLSLRFFFVDTQGQYVVNFLFLILFLGLSGVLTKEIIKGVYEEEKLDTINSELEKLVIAKDEFMRIASLQLRTPLTVIIGYLSMIIGNKQDEYTLSDKASQDLKKAYTSAQNLNGIVNDLLSANAINSGEFNVNVQKDIDIQELFEGALEAKEVLFTDKQTDVSFKVKGSNPLVEIDKPKVLEVFNNLVDNAVFYGNGKVWITLSLQKTQIKILIKDNGVGISSEDAARIWKKFERGKKSPTINPNGSGLGLYLAKMIVKKHHGKITVESEGTGKGSEFMIQLPRTQPK